jgi:hypothetical protein
MQAGKNPQDGIAGCRRDPSTIQGCTPYVPTPTGPTRPEGGMKSRGCRPGSGVPMPASSPCSARDRMHPHVGGQGGTRSDVSAPQGRLHALCPAAPDAQATPDRPGANQASPRSSTARIPIQRWGRACQDLSFGPRAPLRATLARAGRFPLLAIPDIRRPNLLTDALSRPAFFAAISAPGADAGTIRLLSPMGRPAPGPEGLPAASPHPMGVDALACLPRGTAKAVHTSGRHCAPAERHVLRGFCANPSTTQSQRPLIRELTP